jgi:hypothetical protein
MMLSGIGLADVCKKQLVDKNGENIVHLSIALLQSRLGGM